MCIHRWRQTDGQTERRERETSGETDTERDTHMEGDRGRGTGRGRESCTVESVVYFEDSVELNTSEPELHKIMKPLDHFQITKLDKSAVAWQS